MAAATNAMSSSTSGKELTPDSTSEETAAKTAYKRYEALMTVRTKALKGKGAWYWTHLQPILIVDSESNAPKAVKLRCSLCDAVFSASNPSRTASEHLKRGTCPNFSSTPAAADAAGDREAIIPHHQQPKPISSIAPASSSRKRSGNPYRMEVITYSPSPSTPPGLSLPSPQQPNMVLSGGKGDLGSLAMLEDSVKKLKSPNIASPSPALSKSQIEYSVSLLSDWFYECAGLVSFSSVEHPKFRAFLRQVGLPLISGRDLAGARLDARYEELRSDADARINEALFFQVAADGWKPRSHVDGGDSLVSLTVNLPNGTAVFRRALIADSRIPCKYAEDVLWDTVGDACGSGRATRCAGIISDRFKSTALRSLESQNHWMVNLACQLQGFRSLIKDFARGLPLFHNVTSKSSRIAMFFNNNSFARSLFQKYQTQEVDRPASLLCCSSGINDGDFMVEDIIASSRPLQLAVHDDSYKLLCLDNPEANLLAELIRDMKFWKELEAANSLVKLIAGMVQEMETDRPLVGQCLPIWEELRSKIKGWCPKYSADEAAVFKVFDKRFKRNYHPAWSAAFILDPLYLTKDTSGKYLPPYKCLTPEQDKDVDRLITRLASREEAHIVLNELMKWRSEGMDPIYAQAVQVKQLDPATGKMRIANPQSRRLVWETCLNEEFGSLAKVAARLIFLNATARGFKCNPSLVRWLRQQGRSTAGMERAQKMIFIAAQSRLERRDFSGDEAKDVRLFANGDVDELNETFMDASS
ncbi:hypothetical protein KSP39_PZI008502 [Platanthera zijinensis]|uniref:DUF7963 domain-containing protein n=1 Tax=Platanthera zijinensis TaxID=2320716 RepID=A0AAP0BMG1_9ASPA